MKLTKRDAARQKRLVAALRKGKALGGILAGLAALAPVAGCKYDSNPQELECGLIDDYVTSGVIPDIDEEEVEVKKVPTFPKLATTNAVREVKSPNRRPRTMGKIVAPTNRVREVIESPVSVVGMRPVKKK